MSACVDEPAAAAARHQDGPPGPAAYWGVGAPGPSALQHHTLVCWTERSLGGSVSGQAGRQQHRTSLFRSCGQLGEPAQIELAGFHSALLRWPLLMDFPAALKQVLLAEALTPALECARHDS